MLLPDMSLPEWDDSLSGHVLSLHGYRFDSIGNLGDSAIGFSTLSDTFECSLVVLGTDSLEDSLCEIREFWELTLCSNNWSVWQCQKRVQEIQADQKRYHDGHSKYREFDIGQSVLVRNLRDDAKWIPDTIVERTGPVSYRLQVLDQVSV